MKKTGKLLLSVLLVLTMVLSGFAAGGAGGLRVSADSDSIVVEEGQQSVALPDRGPKDGHDFLGWKNVTTGEIIEAGKQVTGPVTLIPVWEKDADEEDDEKDDEENDYDEFEPEDASSEEDLLTGGEDGFEGEGAALTDEEDGEGEDPTPDEEAAEDPTPTEEGTEDQALTEEDAEDPTPTEEEGEDPTPTEEETEGQIPAEEEDGDETPAEPEVNDNEAVPAAAEPAAEEDEEPAPAEEAPAAEEAEEAEEADAEEDLQKAGSCKVTFDLNGVDGTGPEAKTVEENNSVEKPKDPKADGYTFVEWCEDKEGTKPYDFTNLVDKDLTLYAKWTAHKYSVKFDANGGTGTMADETGFEYGVEKALTKNAFTREEYAFDGWNTKADGSGDPFKDEEKVKNLTAKDEDSVTLYAQWKSTKKYTVKFDANGRGTAPAAQTVASGDKAAEPAKPTATGYTCTGWFTDKECKNAYDFSTAVTENKTLYAGWRANKYTIHFDPNGGTTGSTADMSCTYDTKANLTKNGFGRGADWMFIGWNTKADRSGTAYADQAEVLNLTATDGGTVNLYAQWKFIYRVIAGANGTVSKLNTQGMTFQTNGNAAQFTGILVDGKAVGGTLYSAWAGSKGGTFINLKQDFIKTLSIGTHTIDFLYTDGSCSTAFTVNNSTVVNPVSTGDNNHMAAWAGLLAGAVVLAVGMVVLKKRFWNNEG